MRKLGIALNSTQIILKAIELFKDFEEKNYNALISWYYSFLKRNNYSIRHITHTGQKIKENSKNELIKFLNIIYKIRIDYNIKENYDMIINMDETPIWFEMTGKTTVEKIGTKNVEVKIFGTERLRISLLLAIILNGNKLKPLLVFKGKFNSNKQNKLNKLDIVVNKNIYTVCQENSWVTTEIFDYWVENILFSYGRSINRDSFKLLIMDRATTHFENNLNEKLEKEKWKYSLIPSGLTRFCQPLDISINYPMKAYLHQIDTLYRIKTLNKIKPSEEEIIKEVFNIWIDPYKITKEMIFHSFKKTGISVKLDNSERGLINISEQLTEENDIPDPDNLLVQKFNINEFMPLSNTLSQNKIGNTQKSLYDYYSQNNYEMDID